MTALGDASADGLADRGSTPRTSTMASTVLAMRSPGSKIKEWSGGNQWSIVGYLGRIATPTRLDVVDRFDGVVRYFDDLALLLVRTRQQQPISCGSLADCQTDQRLVTAVIVHPDSAFHLTRFVCSMFLPVRDRAQTFEMRGLRTRHMGNPPAC